MHELRYGLRTLLKQRGFTTIVVLTLALATGATTAIFSVVHSVLLRPLPFRDPDRLVDVFEIGRVGGPSAVFYTDLEEFRRQSTLFESFTAYGRTTKHLDGPGGLQRLTAVFSDREFFRVLDVNPILGRTFEPRDRGQLAVIAARVWEEHFDRSPGTIGSAITLIGQRFDAQLKRTVIDRVPFTVVGVMPEAFQFPYKGATSFPGAMPEARTDLWLYDERDPRGGRWTVVGRMKPGATVAAAQAELDAIERRLDTAAPDPSVRPIGVHVASVSEGVLGSIRRSLWLLFGAVALVLAAACANVANLLLARMTVRAREVAVREALGAGRPRLVRQFMLESAILSLAGGVLGAVVAGWGMRLLVAIGSASIPRAHEVALDWQVFAFLLVLCLATALLFGLAPALGAARADITTLSKEAGGQATAGRRFARLRDALVVAEVALAFVLALGAAVVIAELDRLRDVDSGMQTEHVLTFHMTPRAADADYLQIEERVASLPHVEAAGWIQLVPLQNWGWIGDYAVRGQPHEPGRLTVELRTVTPGYFETLGVPVIEGRGPARSDTGGPPVIFINETLAKRDFPGGSPVGRETNRGVIAGVVRDVRQVTLDQPAAPEIYQPLGGGAGIATDLGMTLLVRSAAPRDALVSAVRSEVRAVNPTLAIFNIKSMDQVVDDSVWELNLYRWLISLFAALALALVMIGLYGVISYGVAARTREFAIRLALGSDETTIARLVLGRGAILTAVGVVIGAAASVALMRGITTLPLGARPGVTTFLLIAVLLLAIALAACALPALRVKAVNPLTALRQD